MVTHSSINGEEATLDRMRDAGLEPSVVARVDGPLGPLLAARAATLEERGLLEPGERREDLLIVAGADDGDMAGLAVYLHGGRGGVAAATPLRSGLGPRAAAGGSTVRATAIRGRSRRSPRPRRSPPARPVCREPPPRTTPPSGAGPPRARVVDRSLTSALFPAAVG